VTEPHVCKQRGLVRSAFETDIQFSGTEMEINGKMSLR